MSEQDFQDDDLLSEDRMLDTTLVEYADSMEAEARALFLERLDQDRDFYMLMGKTLSEMAMLIASAAVSDEEAQFLKISRKIMLESRKDTQPVRDMRLFYLNNRQAVDMGPLLDGEEEEQRFDARLLSFAEDYKQMPVYAGE